MITSKEKLERVIDILNRHPGINFTPKDLATKISLGADRRTVESLSCSLGTMLSTLAAVGLVGKKERQHGQVKRVTYHHLKKVELV